MRQKIAIHKTGPFGQDGISHSIKGGKQKWRKFVGERQKTASVSDTTHIARERLGLRIMRVVCPPVLAEDHKMLGRCCTGGRHERSPSPPRSSEWWNKLGQVDCLLQGQEKSSRLTSTTGDTYDQVAPLIRAPLLANGLAARDLHWYLLLLRETGTDSRRELKRLLKERGTG
jgi:hypothetical protein